MTTSNDLQLLNNFIHDLNQPLQVIIGETNVCLLDIKSGKLKDDIIPRLQKIISASNDIITLSHNTQFEVNQRDK